MLFNKLLDIPVRSGPRPNTAKLDQQLTFKEENKESNQIVTDSGLPESYLATCIRLQNDQVNKVRATSDYIHVSSLIGMCPRQYALMAQMGDVLGDRIGTAHQVMWALGRAAENHIRDSYIRHVDFKGVLGRWTCRCGSSIHEGRYESDLQCGTCKTVLDRYREFVLVDEECGVIGSPDLVFELNGKVYVVECKSIKGGEGTNAHKGFDALDMPLGDHVFQARMYTHLLKLAGYDVADELIIIYVNKDFQIRNDRVLKEFHVDVSAPEHQAAIDRALFEAKEVMDYLRGKGPLPERVLCEDDSGARATKCPAATRCFSI